MTKREPLESHDVNVKRIRNMPTESIDQDQDLSDLKDIIERLKKAETSFDMLNDGQKSRRKSILTDEIKICQDELMSIKSQKIVIGFYAGSGAGKSFTINQIIGVNILPSKSGGDPTKGELISSGCTRYPVKCTFSKENMFVIETIKINKLGKKELISKNSFNNEQSLQHHLLNLNNTNEFEFDYIIIHIPELLLRSNDLSFISCVDFLDLVGVPDEELKELANQRNSSIILHEGLDAAFILKRTDSDRGKIYPKDLIELNKSSIFKRNLHSNEEKNLPPKLVSIWAFEVNNFEKYDYSEQTNYYENNSENFKQHLEASLDTISKKIMNEEAKQKLRQFENNQNYKAYRTDHEIYSYFKNCEYEEMKSRIDSLLIFPRNHVLRSKTTSHLNDIINEIKEFKKDKLVRKILIKLSQLNTNLIGKYYSAMSKEKSGEMFKFLNKNKVKLRQNRKNKGHIKKKITFFQMNINKILEALKQQKDNQISINDSNSSLKNELDAKLNRQKEISKREISSYFTSYTKTIRDFYDKCNPDVRAKYEINPYFTNEYFEEFVSENLPTFESDCEKFTDDLVESTNKIMSDKYDSVKHEIYFEKESKNNQNGLSSLKLLYENSKILKAKKTIISNKEVIDNENFPRLLNSSTSSRIPCSSGNLEKIQALINKIQSFKLSEAAYFDQSMSDLVKLLKVEHLISARLQANNIKNRIKSTLNWKPTKYKNIYSDHLQTRSKFTMEEFEIKKYFESKLNNDKKNLNINCAMDVHSQIISKIDALNKKLAIKRDDNFQDKNIALNPIFIWISFENLISNKTINNVYNFIKSIASTITCDNFVVFLFIEKHSDSKTEEKFKESFNLLLKSIEAISEDINSSVVINLIDDSAVKPLNKKIYKHLIAKYFNLERYYSVSEKIDSFFEYNNTLMEFKNNVDSTVKALDFMAKVLSQGSYESQEEISNDDFDFINWFMFTLSRGKFITSQELEVLKTATKNYSINKNKESLASSFSMLKNIKSQLPNDLQTEFDQCFNILQGSKSQYLTEIILANKNKVEAKDMIQLNKTCECYFTHKHEKPKDNDVVLINTNTMDEIFPITNIDRDYKLEEEDLFFYKLTSKTASCYIVYFYTYETNFLEYNGSLTEQQLLNWKLPSLEISNSNDMKIPHDRKIKLPELRLWQDFAGSYKTHPVNLVDEIFSIPYISVNKQEFKQKLSLHLFLTDILNNVFSNNILNDNESGENYYFEPSNSENIDADGNIVMHDQESTRLMHIEVHSQKMLDCLDKTSLFDYVCLKKKNKKPLYCLQQIFECLSSNSCKYGILTTYEQTWFIKYEEDTNLLYISDTVKKNDFLRSMNYFIYLAIKDNTNEICDS